MVPTKKSVTPGKNWATQKAKIKSRFPQLNDADLNYDESKKNEMFAKLSKKLGQTNKELQVIIETL